MKGQAVDFNDFICFNQTRLEITVSTVQFVLGADDWYHNQRLVAVDPHTLMTIKSMQAASIEQGMASTARSVSDSLLALCKCRRRCPTPSEPLKQLHQSLSRLLHNLPAGELLETQTIQDSSSERSVLTAQASSCLTCGQIKVVASAIRRQ